MRFAQLINSVENKPGIYMMLDKSKRPIYIGKAKNLKKRLNQYFSQPVTAKRTAHMLSLVVDIKLIITSNEFEALLLESRMIKKEQPVYNVLLKDDKSFPYLSFKDHAFPSVVVRRTKQRNDGKYTSFGPYPCRNQVDMLLDQIQKVFRLRNCSDHYFRNRSRPCMQYEINRCSAPCVKLISADDYAKDVKLAQRFLTGGAAAARREADLVPARAAGPLLRPLVIARLFGCGLRPTRTHARRLPRGAALGAARARAWLWSDGRAAASSGIDRVPASAAGVRGKRAMALACAATEVDDAAGPRAAGDDPGGPNGGRPPHGHASKPYVSASAASTTQ